MYEDLCRSILETDGAIYEGTLPSEEARKKFGKKYRLRPQQYNRQFRFLKFRDKKEPFRGCQHRLRVIARKVGLKNTLDPDHRSYKPVIVARPDRPVTRAEFEAVLRRIDQLERDTSPHRLAGYVD
jgi:hypothetical protein